MFDGKFIREVEHNPVPPIAMERGAGDTVIIGGITFHADFFRSFNSELSDKVLYHIDKDGAYHLIRTLHEAAMFFCPELLEEIASR